MSEKPKRPLNGYFLFKEDYTKSAEGIKKKEEFKEYKEFTSYVATLYKEVIYNIYKKLPEAERKKFEDKY